MQQTPANAAKCSDVTPPYLRHLVRLIRPFPDFDLPGVGSLRAYAVQKLGLKTGDRVLDAGCGPGGSFPFLVRDVGTAGEVDGIEISPEATINARRKIARHAWRNVQVITADAKDVKLSGQFDAMLMLGAPDVYGSPKVLANLVPYLKDGAKVVAFGAKLSHSTFARAINPIFRRAFSKATFTSTPQLDYQPWKPLELYTGSLTVEVRSGGWMSLPGEHSRLPLRSRVSNPGIALGNTWRCSCPVDPGSDPPSLYQSHLRALAHLPY